VLYAAAGLCGVALYFLFQNIGLVYTLASNAGVIIAVAPMFTAIVSYFLVSRTSLHRNFIIGFFITIAGVALISFNGNFILKLNPLGALGRHTDDPGRFVLGLLLQYSRSDQ